MSEETVTDPCRDQPWEITEPQGKRTFDSEDSSFGPNKKLRTQEHFRLLVPAKCAGSVIGKGGENIKKVREACPQAIIKVPDAQNVPERIIQIACAGEEIPIVLGLIGPEIFKNLTRPGDNQQDELSLLVPSEQMGGVIGKGGATIKKIRTESGAFLKSFSAKLPCCDERVLLFKGELSQMIAAIIMTLEVCAENPLKWNCQFYDPSNALMGREDDCGGYVNVSDSGSARMSHGTTFVRGHSQRGPSTRGPPPPGSYPPYRHPPQHPQYDFAASPYESGATAPSPDGKIGSGPNYNSFTGTKDAEYIPQTGAYDSGYVHPSRGIDGCPDRYGGAVPPPTSSQHFASPGGFESRLLRSELLDQMKAKHPFTPYTDEDSMNFVTKEVTLENHMTGSIIGPRGSRIGEIRNTCGAKIRIGDVNSAAEGERLITISGTQQDCHLAEYMLQSSVQMFTAAAQVKQNTGRRKLRP